MAAEVRARADIELVEPPGEEAVAEGEPRHQPTVEDAATRSQADVLVDDAPRRLAGRARRPGRRHGALVADARRDVAQADGARGDAEGRLQLVLLARAERAELVATERRAVDAIQRRVEHAGAGDVESAP